MAVVYIGLGTNIGDRQNNLNKAIDHIDNLIQTKIKSLSSVKETEPVDLLDQPPFLNQVISIETGLIAPELFTYLQKIERSMGRDKIIPKGPRIIDLDILLYDDFKLRTGELTIPHHAITARDFVMEHLVELDPDLRDPISGQRYREILDNKLL